MTCIKCQKLKPHMISMCADCYKDNMAHMAYQLRHKKACDVGGALAEKLNRIRKQVEALRDLSKKNHEAFHGSACNGAAFEHGKYRAHQEILDLIDAE